jgi:hypothetical protein
MSTRSEGPFLQRSIRQFVGDRDAIIDRAFSLYLNLSPTAEGDCSEGDIDLRKIYLSFRVVDTVTWINLIPALDLLAKDHELLPSYLYYTLNRGVSRWFRVFDFDEARCRWDDWDMMRSEEEEAEREECARNGVPYTPGEPRREPKLPECVLPAPPQLPAPAFTLAKSRKVKRIVHACEQLASIAAKDAPEVVCPYDESDRELLFPDADPNAPLLALAFGEHDIITELLNDELELAGQVALEPYPIFKMDGTDPASIATAFQCADLALDTLAAAANVLLLLPGFQPLS